MKTVIKFRGKEYEAPAKSKYLAIDKNGGVFIYRKEPWYFEIVNAWIPASGEGLDIIPRFLCKVKPPKHPEQELYKLEAV